MKNESKEVKMPTEVITEDMMAKMRAKIGKTLRIDHSINNQEATKIAIRKFVDGIGDGNPIFSDEEYARKTRYGALIAPPSWIFSVFSGLQFGWAGLGGFHNQTEAEFFKPIKKGDSIFPECIYTGFDGPKASSFAEKIVVDKKENTYRNQNGEIVARTKWSSIRMERLKAREKGKYTKLELPHPWTDDQLKKIEEEVLSEEVRGNVTRYWEDVRVDDEIKPLVKGPLGMTDEIAFLIGGGAPIPRLAAHGVQLRQYRSHPAWAFRDPSTYALEPIYSVHYNKAAAAAQGGLPMQYDVGFQRHSWQIQSLTDWMGDEGWLKRSYVEFRKFVYHSDVVWLKGKITRKYVDENNEYCIDLETSTINQREENVMPGNATIILPSKEKGVFPVQIRL